MPVPQGPVEVLPAAHAGAYAYVNRCLWTPPGPSGAMPGPWLLAPGRLAEVVACFSASIGGGDRRAVASLWLQVYLERLVPPVLAATFTGRLAPLPDIAEMGILMGQDGAPSGFVVRCAGAAGAAPVHRLLRAHLAPLIEALARETGAGRRLLWCNVAQALLTVALVASGLPEPMRPPDAWTDALLAAPRLADGAPNPLAALTIAGEGGGRRRRLCCLRHRVCGLQPCQDCPQPERTL